MGVALARKERATVRPILLGQGPALRVAEDANSVGYNPNPILRGISELRIAFDRD